jgi:hypothetical protein
LLKMLVAIQEEQEVQMEQIRHRHHPELEQQ